MLLDFKNTIQDFSRLLFPHYCVGCNNDINDRNAVLCYHCQLALPATHFFSIPNNPVERSFYGRLPLQAAAAAYYFTKDSLMQELIAELKYKQNTAVGFFLGRMMGYELMHSERFASIDGMIPMPLHPKKLRSRGYNQATIIATGIQSVWNKPIYENLISRKIFSISQTTQDRIHRWENMEGIFALKYEQQILQKHLLLVDDVTTTGASMEALGSVLETLEGVKLSVATAAYTV